MFTAYNTTTPQTNFGFNNAFDQPLTPSGISMELYNRYRDVFTGLVNSSNPELIYRAIGNSDDSFNGYGLHEKLIHNGRSVVDISVGVLDFPWSAADAYQGTEITLEMLEGIAMDEEVFYVASRLQSIVTLVRDLPPYTRIFYYVGRDGTRAVTIDDEFNLVKANAIVSYVGV